MTINNFEIENNRAIKYNGNKNDDNVIIPQEVKFLSTEVFNNLVAGHKSNVIMLNNLSILANDIIIENPKKYSFMIIDTIYVNDDLNLMNAFSKIVILSIYKLHINFNNINNSQFYSHLYEFSHNIKNIEFDNVPLDEYPKLLKTINSINISRKTSINVIGSNTLKVQLNEDKITQDFLEIKELKVAHLNIDFKNNNIEQFTPYLKMLSKNVNQIVFTNVSLERYPIMLQELRKNNIDVSLITFKVIGNDGGILIIFGTDLVSFSEYESIDKSVEIEIKIPEGVESICKDRIGRISSNTCLILPSSMKELHLPIEIIPSIIVSDKAKFPEMSLYSNLHHSSNKLQFSDISLKKKIKSMPIKDRSYCIERQLIHYIFKFFITLEINVYKDLDIISKTFNCALNTNEVRAEDGYSHISDSYTNNKIIINSATEIPNWKKKRFEKLVAKKFARTEVEFRVIPNLGQKEEPKKEEKNDISTNQDYLSDEVKALLENINAKKSILSEKGAFNLTQECERILNEYKASLEKSKPNLNKALNGELVFGVNSPLELKKDLICDLNKLLSVFYHQDLEELIKEIIKYQNILNNQEIKETNVEENDKIQYIIDIINKDNSIELKEILNNILQNNLQIAQKTIEQDLDDVTELTLDNKYSVFTFNQEIDELYNKTIEYEMRNEQLYNLLEELKMIKESEFAKEIKNYQNKLEELKDEKVINLFNETISKYQEYIIKSMNWNNKEEVDIEYTKQMIRYALSSIDLYLITKNKEAIKYEDFKEDLQKGLSILNNEETELNYFEEIKLIKEKTDDLPKEEQEVINTKIKEIINKWIQFLEKPDKEYIQRLIKETNGDKTYAGEKVPGLYLKSEELFVYYLIIKEIKELEYNLNKYIDDKVAYEQAIKGV